ncbi:MAG: hypothetical protein LBM09_02400 [Candidatus Nomurabacteria bacterium]|jgi:hypothetical protein|nr:hypothetical protein [Candidatus Nomurabacteria bacterium]
MAYENNADGYSYGSDVEVKKYYAELTEKNRRFLADIALKMQNVEIGSTGILAIGSHAKREAVDSSGLQIDMILHENKTSEEVKEYMQTIADEVDGLNVDYQGAIKTYDLSTPYSGGGLTIGTKGGDGHCHVWIDRVLSADLLVGNESDFAEIYARAQRDFYEYGARKIRESARNVLKSFRRANETGVYKDKQFDLETGEIYGGLKFGPLRFMQSFLALDHFKKQRPMLTDNLHTTENRIREYFSDSLMSDDAISAYKRALLIQHQLLKLKSAAKTDEEKSECKIKLSPSELSDITKSIQCFVSENDK